VIGAQHEIMIAAPPPSVWTLVSDPSHLPEWLVLCDKVEVIEPGEVGMKLRLFHRARAGRKSSPVTETDVEVTVFSPPRELAWRVTGERLAGSPVKRFARETRFQVLLEPRGGDTKVRVRSEQEARSLIHGLLIRAFGLKAGRQAMARSLQRLKALAMAR
jgi:carbon monoxide dehydrogenase subunit G